MLAVTAASVHIRTYPYLYVLPHPKKAGCLFKDSRLNTFFQKKLLLISFFFIFIFVDLLHLGKVGY